MAAVVCDQVTAVGMDLDNFVRINEAALDLAENNVSHLVVRLLSKSQQRAAFEDRQHGLAEALHFAFAFGLQFRPESMVFIHVMRINYVVGGYRRIPLQCHGAVFEGDKVGVFPQTEGKPATKFADQRRGLHRESGQGMVQIRFSEFSACQSRHLELVQKQMQGSLVGHG